VCNESKSEKEYEKRGKKRERMVSAKCDKLSQNTIELYHNIEKSIIISRTLQDGEDS